MNHSLTSDYLASRVSACLDGAKINKDTGIIVACSGGPDSMALSLLAQGWATKNNVTVIILTIDHQLRPESSQEALQVETWCKLHRLRHQTLVWSGKKPRSNVQEHAREARYRLLLEYAKSHWIEHILLAHHLDDQAETFLLRLARGSGVAGLSCMSERSVMGGVTLLRPLLTSYKSELMAYLEERNQPYIHDPSNDNYSYDRVKMRALLPALAPYGITREKLFSTTKNMTRARQALEYYTNEFFAKECRIYPESYVVIAHLDAPDDIALRLLSLVIMAISGQKKPARLEDLERLLTELRQPAFRGASLSGCLLIPHKAQIVVLREPAAVVAPVAVTEKMIVWDNRFTITVNSLKNNYWCGPLTQQGWLSLAREHGIKNHTPNKKILYTLPTLRNANNDIIAVPHLGYRIDAKLKVTAKLISESI